MNPQNNIHDSKSKKIELVIQQLNSLPTLPAVAARLLQITVRSDTQADEVVQLIESDPSLASKIITMATRANTGISKQVATLSKVVVLLGFDAVRNAVLSIKVFETLDRATSTNFEEEFDRIGFWKHSLAVACGAKMLIKYFDPAVDSEEAFVCGLLHDMGKLALDTCLPRSFSRVVQLAESSMGNIADMERKVLGLDHTIAGRRLASKWNMPDSIEETVWLHHHWMKGLPEAVKNPGILQAVHLADILAREMRLGYSGNHFIPQSAGETAEELGCPAKVIAEISAQLPQAISERAAMLGLDDIEPANLYQDALSDANVELGRLNSRLRQQNQKLQLRSRYFDLLVKLDSALAGGQTVTDICQLVARLWQEHTRSSFAAVYSFSPEDSIITGAIKTAADKEATVFLVDREENSDSETGPNEEAFSAGFSIAPAGKTHAWFFEQVAPACDVLQTRMFPLRVGGEFIGAVLWQDEADDEYYRQQEKEIQAFAASCSLAVFQSNKREKQEIICEQLAQSNALLQKAQQELIRQKSLVSVGEMACGAAHEINNPLAVIVGRAELLASREEDPEKKTTLESIARQGQAVSQIIKELLEFAQPAAAQPAYMSVRDLIETALQNHLDAAEEANISFQVQIEEDLPELYVDRDQIIGAISEVIANAIESYTGEPGEVAVTASYNDLDDEIVIEVVDRGCGMDDVTRRKATDPFFSAKQAGRKRGLGLSRSVRNMEINGGRLNIESVPEQGTVVRLVLPISREAPEQNAAAEQGHCSVQGQCQVSVKGEENLVIQEDNLENHIVSQ